MRYSVGGRLVSFDSHLVVPQNAKPPMTSGRVRSRPSFSKLRKSHLNPSSLVDTSGQSIVQGPKFVFDVIPMLLG